MASKRTPSFMMRVNTMRPFSITVDKLQQANAQGSAFGDWSGLLSQVKRDDILSCSDTAWMSSLVRSVALSGDSTHADAINEYHRK